MSKPSSSRHPTRSRYCVQRGADFAVERPQGVEHLTWIAVRLEQLASRRIVGDRSDEPLKLVRCTRRHGRRTAQHAERVGRRDTGPVLEVRQQVSDRQHRRGGETHVLVDHLAVMIAASGQVRDQLGVGERVGIDRLELAVRRDRGGLGGLVPLAKLLAPDLLLEHLVGTLEATRDLVVSDEMHRQVRETVDVLHLHVVEEHPVVAGELSGATRKRLGMHLGPISGRRARKVHGVERPGPGARGLEAKVCCRLLGRHRSPPRSFRPTTAFRWPFSPAASTRNNQGSEGLRGPPRVSNEAVDRWR